MPPCPGVERLAAFREGVLPLGATEALEDHLLACPECREILRSSPAGDPPVLSMDVLERLGALRPGRNPYRAAAAAALLLAAGLVAWRIRQDGPPAPSAPLAPSALASPLDLVVGPGSHIETLGASRLRLVSGTLWLETPAPFKVEIPGGILEIESGRWVLESPRKDFAWIPSAEAGEGNPAVRIWILEGRGRLRTERLEAPARVDLGGEGTVSRSPLPPPEAEALERRRLEALLALPEMPREGPPPPSYRWVSTFTGREGSAEAVLVFPVAGVWRRWVVGLAGDRPRASESVEVRWDGSRLRARVDGHKVLDLDAAQATHLLPEADRPGWEVRVLGGRAALAQSKVLR